MIRTLLCAGLLLALFSLGATAQTVALHADFNSETVDTQPSSDPAGDPDGDFLLIYHSGGPVLVQESVGAMTDKPLLFDRTTVPGSIGIEARLDPDLRDCDSYVVRWTSMVPAIVGFWPVSLRGPSGALIGGPEYRSGYALTWNSASLSVGYTPGVPQTFEITLDFVNETVSLSVDDVPIPEAQDLPVYTTELWSVNMSPGLNDLNQFVLDDLEVIGTACTTVRAEDHSWGAVKARF